MKAGILLCDHTREHLQPIFGDYWEVFVAMLNKFGIESEVYDLTENVFPPSHDAVDVFIITGSKISCYENLDWIKRLCQFVLECRESDTKLIGICFGHQLITHALGGQVQLSSKGWGIGVHSYQVIDEQHIFGGRHNVKALVSHQDQVITPAEGAKVVATSDFCPYAMLNYGENIISIQCHPELSKDYIKTILDIRREQIGEQTYNQAHRDFHKRTDSALVFCALLRYLGFDRFTP